MQVAGRLVYFVVFSACQLPQPFHYRDIPGLRLSGLQGSQGPSVRRPGACRQFLSSRMALDSLEHQPLSEIVLYHHW